jgi:hypothetical protein
MKNIATTKKSLPERTRAFYEAVSKDGEKALSELPAVYATDVEFSNPVGKDRGLAEFEKVWIKGFRTYKLLEFQNIEVVGNDEYFTMTYTMAVKFALGPVFKSRMATSFYGKEGKVCFTRDYFDPLGSLLAPFPVMSWGYQKVIGAFI